VELLEANLARANGDRQYLATLRDAYRCYVKELALTKQAAAAEVYQKRLQILDDNDPAPVNATAPKDTQFVGPPKVTIAVTPSYVARGQMPDPFAPENEAKGSALDVSPRPYAKSLLLQGDSEFELKHYDKAKALYEQASGANPQTLATEARGRWAYCQLMLVAQQLARFPEQPCDWARMEADAKGAAQAAPNLARWGDDLLHAMKTNRAAVPAELSKGGAPAVVAVKHSSKASSGYQLAETDHFRIFHHQTPDYAEKVAQVAEMTRLQMSRRWLGKDGDDWQPKCDIFLHTTAAEYSERTRQNPAYPGHSRIELDERNGRVVNREMHLRCDNLGMLEAILPHETTHVVLAGNFGNRHVPRWVDEGVAVLTEPTEKIKQHKLNLTRSLQNRELIPLRDLVQLSNFPEARQITVFYAQSVALVDYLTSLKGSLAFTQFVREALKDGYDVALRKHYGFQTFGEFQDRFTEHVLAEANGTAPTYAGRN
jgi:hypothetical protein